MPPGPVAFATPCGRAPCRLVAPIAPPPWQLSCRAWPPAPHPSGFVRLPIQVSFFLRIFFPLPLFNPLCAHHPHSSLRVRRTNRGEKFVERGDCTSPGRTWALGVKPFFRGRGMSPFARLWPRHASSGRALAQACLLWPCSGQGMSLPGRLWPRHVSFRPSLAKACLLSPCSAQGMLPLALLCPRHASAFG